MEDREYSEDEKITMLTQDMEFLGDNFLNAICLFHVGDLGH